MSNGVLGRKVDLAAPFASVAATAAEVAEAR
ncbi:MAG: hypothetical protein JWR64_2448, partial [Marmoricola sp.]|nr:hypothetical protein [Marmoricola sp.]